MPLHKKMNNKLIILLSVSASLSVYSYANSPQEPLIQIHNETADPLPNLHVTGFSLINQSSHTELARHNADERMPPASLTKLMTLYVTYDYLDKGLIQPHESVHISTKAWKTEGSRMFLEPDSEVKLNELVRGVSIVSGNDASVALAEHIAGTEANFVKLMNKKAQSIGLENTHFENSTGLPHINHYSTPQDMTLLAMNLITEHPAILEHTKEKSMTYQKITQDNRNRLLWKDPTVFGLKTGHTKEAGYCLVVAAKRNEQTLLATVFGAKSEKSRDAAISKLLNHAQSGFKNIVINDDKKIPDVRVWYGQTSYLRPVLKNSVQLSIPIKTAKKVHTRIQVPKELKAPIKNGTTIGEYQVYIDDNLRDTTPLVASSTIPEQSILRQMIEWIHYQVHHLIHLILA